MTEALRIPDELDLSFDHFWKEYPRKDNKKKAEVAFKNLTKADKFSAIQGVIYHRDENPQWRNKKFVPLPTTYIHGERWNDTVAKDIKEEMAEQVVSNEAELVWVAMTQFYGESWLKKNGDRPTEMWRKLLKGMPEARLKRGLKCTFDSGSDFPPSLPKFMEYCKPTFGELHPSRPALPRPEGSAKTALAALGEMKKILGV